MGVDGDNASNALGAEDRSKQRLERLEEMPFQAGKLGRSWSSIRRGPCSAASSTNNDRREGHGQMQASQDQEKRVLCAAAYKRFSGGIYSDAVHLFQGG